MAVNNLNFTNPIISEPFLDYCARKDPEALDKIDQLNKTLHKNAIATEKTHFSKNILHYLRKNELPTENLGDITQENLFEKLLQNLDEINKTKLFHLLEQTDSKDLYSNPLYLFILKSVTSDKRREALKFITSLLSQGSNAHFYILINGQRGLHSEFTHALLEKIKADCWNKLSLRGRISLWVITKSERSDFIFENAVKNLMDTISITILPLGCAGWTMILNRFHFLSGQELSFHEALRNFNTGSSLLFGLSFGVKSGFNYAERFSPHFLSKLKSSVVGALVGGVLTLASHKFLTFTTSLLAKTFFGETVEVIAGYSILPIIGMYDLFNGDNIGRAFFIQDITRYIARFVQRALS